MLKEGVSILSELRPLTFLVKGRICRVAVFLGGDLWDDPGDFSDCDPQTWTGVPAVPVVTDVPVSPSSAVTEICEGFSPHSDREFVEPQSSSFSKKRSADSQ